MVAGKNNRNIIKFTTIQDALGDRFEGLQSIQDNHRHGKKKISPRDPKRVQKIVERVQQKEKLVYSQLSQDELLNHTSPSISDTLPQPESPKDNGKINTYVELESVYQSAGVIVESVRKNVIIITDPVIHRNRDMRNTQVSIPTEKSAKVKRQY